MAMDDAERAALIAAWRAAHAAPDDRRERVLSRLLSRDDYAVLLPDEPVVRRWPLVLLAVAAAVLAMLALELTGELAARLGQRGRFEAVDSAKGVRAASVADEVSPAQESGRRTAELHPVAELPAMPPSPVVPLVPAAATTKDGVPIQRPRALATAESSPPPVVEDVVPEDPAVREAGYIAEARAALARRAWVDASIALDRHLAEFPDGARKRDREALRIIVACRLDPGDRTRAAAREFIVRHAASDDTPRIVGACRADVGFASPFE
jgi:hypothetical protein